MRLCAVLFFASSVANAQTWTFDPADNAVEFHGRAALVDIEGVTSKVEGSLVQTGEKLSGVLTVDLRPYRTDNELRDSHMHQKYLETAKYPKAELALKDVLFKEGGNTPFCGQLKVKADTQEVCGAYTLKGDQLEAGFALSFEKLPSLGIPGWAGVTMSDEVSVTVKAKVAKK